jgi:hypothetical protein
MVERERVTHPALLAVRRNDGHLAERLRGLDEALYPVRKNAVVVRD